jgi:hypothetical protein
MNKRTLLSLILSCLVLSTIYSQELKVTNVSFEVINNFIYIYYDLAGDVDSDYDVSLILRRELKPSFKFIPIHVSGDIGEGQFVGKKRTIVWNVKRDFKIDDEVSDYYFEVTAEEISGFPWYYYLGGAVVSGVAAVFLLNKDEESQDSPGRAAINPPPGRP